MISRSASRLLAISAFALFGGLLAGTPALAADAAHKHDAPAVLELNQGAKWQTDAPLRTGMQTIRDAVAQAVPAVHAGKFDRAQYQKLGQTVEGQVAYIVENCKLEPAADNALHAILAELNTGVEAINGRAAGTAPEQGVVHLVETLNSYASHFEHPGWQGVDAN